MWEIIDSHGVIHSGTENEMQEAFTVMKLFYAKSIAESRNITIKEANELRNKWLCGWDGDLRLIQIHDTYR